MLWHEQSWPVLQNLPRNTPVVIPLGSCEQHGKHLPVFVDSFQVERVTTLAHEQLGDEILLLPTLWLGSSHHHKDYPGTVSILPSLYSQVIQQMAQCVLNAGFHNIVFVNGHGGNHVPVQQALSELVCIDEQADAANLILATWWILAQAELQPDRIGTATPSISHACEYETSTLLAIRPDLVNMDALPDEAGHENLGRFHDPLTKGVSIFHRFRTFSRTGHLGVPRHASAEKGRSIFQVASQRLVEMLRELAQSPLPAKQGPK